VNRLRLSQCRASVRNAASKNSTWYRIEGDELLGYQGSENVEAGAPPGLILVRWIAPGGASLFPSKRRPPPRGKWRGFAAPMAARVPGPVADALPLLGH